MNKYLLILLSIISVHTHTMEIKVKSTDPIIDLSILLTYPTEILDLIAQFLPFYDIEFEDEFIERTKELTTKGLPKEYQHYSSNFTKYTAYSSDNAIIAVSKYDCLSKYDIINRKTNTLQRHRLGNFHQKLAVSCDGNLIATIYRNYDRDPSTGNTVYKDNLYITNLSTKKDDVNNIPGSFELCDEHPTINFNKQETDIIVHAKDSQYKIFPLTVNTPNPNADNKKTFAKYCAQRRICADLVKQISHIKSLNNK
jgi:hypothetical protein